MAEESRTALDQLAEAYFATINKDVIKLLGLLEELERKANEIRDVVAELEKWAPPSVEELENSLDGETLEFLRGMGEIASKAYKARSQITRHLFADDRISRTLIDAIREKLLEMLKNTLK